jgi:hypothetical protein
MKKKPNTCKARHDMGGEFLREEEMNVQFPDNKSLLEQW